MNITHYQIKTPLKPRVWNLITKPVIGGNVKLQNTLLDCWDKITIEDDVFFGHDVKLLTGSHNYRKLGPERQKAILSKPITIKSGVWIASGVIVLGGVTIGHNSVVGAGSVVTRSIPDGEVWAGNPARFIKRLNQP